MSDRTKKTLDDILNEEDESGLLTNLKPLGEVNSSEELRTRQKFEEINLFVDRNGRAPGEGLGDQKLPISERILQYALNGIKGDSKIIDLLAGLDRHGLLKGAATITKAGKTLDDIIESDNDLLNTSADDIFTLRHASLTKPKTQPDRKAERRRIEDFSVFKPLFDACVKDLNSGRRKTLEFKNEQEIQAGEFFILNGAMLYVAEVNEPHIRSGKPNARLRIIFDNGTEGDNLLRSLSAELYKNGPAGRGQRVTSTNDGPIFTGQQEVAYIPPRTAQEEEIPEGIATGEIYVVRSLSNDPGIKAIGGNLFKLGFTTGSVEARIAAAKDDPTFLLAPVRPVKTYRVYNMNTNKLETLLHRFFGDVRLNIEILDRFGVPCNPREWFLVSLDEVDRAIKMLIDGSIVRHRYDKDLGRIVPI